MALSKIKTRDVERDDGTDIITYVDNTQFLPTGTIMMYDGDSWQDNATIPGWYAMIPENEDGGANGLTFGIQSMVDRFVMGGSVAGATGGANSYSLAERQLPIHSHTASSSSAGSHTHTVSGTAAETTNLTGSATHTGQHGNIGLFTSRTGVVTLSDINSEREAGGTGGTAYNTFNIDVDHSHSVSGTAASAGDHTHTITVDTAGSGDAIDNRPAYYQLIFIRKCA